VDLAAAVFGEEVAASVLGGALVRGDGDAVLAGGGALGEEVVAGPHARPAGALAAPALLLRPCAAASCVRTCFISSHTHARTGAKMNYIYTRAAGPRAQLDEIFQRQEAGGEASTYVPAGPLATAAESRRAWRTRITNRVLLLLFILYVPLVAAADSSFSFGV
jgi:hypothetical protein